MRLVVIDSANTLYRAFFGVPPLRNSAGTPTNAVYGFINMLNKVIREENPDHLVAVFDAPGKSFRSELYPDYKATRDAQPEDLTTQFALLREFLDAYRIPVLEVAGVEADDVIATLVASAPADAEIAIVSTDKDLMQLVSERVVLLDTMKDRRLGPEEVEERFGVPPRQLVDVRALAGDPSDNVPGVKGIGVKGAAKLILEWEDLENLLQHVDEVSAKRAREALKHHIEDARLSKRLVILRNDVELPTSPSELVREEPDYERLRALFQKFEFSRLLERLTAAAPEPSDSSTPMSEPSMESSLLMIRAPDELEALRVRIQPRQRLAVVVVHEGGGAEPVDLVGIGLAWADDEAAYLAVGRRDLGDIGGLEVEDALAGIRALLEAPEPRRWGSHDSKSVQTVLLALGVEAPTPSFDTHLAAFLLDPAAVRTLPASAAQHLGRSVRAWEEVAGRGARAVAAGELPTEVVAEWAGQQACAIHALAPFFAQRIEEANLRLLFEQIELPLTGVLARMECAGVRLDLGVLEELSDEYEKELSRIEGEIYALAGEHFLVSSPKQLQHILFEKLKLPIIKKTKTGYSTDEGVLEQLSAHHELPARILAYRHLAKLKNTYIDALPPLVNPASGRIHPTFHQTGAATGRLSSQHPNVQNIPIRSEAGSRIREAFVAAPGMQLVSADYSQVELRILAHFSEDENLIAAFEHGEDIHRRTAATVAGIEPEEVTPDQRARAKAVNFGIIYGSSAFGLANQLGIASAEAQETIDAYFERYRGVRRFLDETIAAARERGYVRTLLERRRYLPDLGSRNRVLSNAAERMAVNSVIQGSAADLIKKAMVELDSVIRAEGLVARLILQVHDELVCEVPLGEVETLTALVRSAMEGVYALRVPLLVDVGVGTSWREAH